MTDKPAPIPTPETAPFWEHCDQEELWLQQCQRCHKHYFYPRPVCPHCGTTDTVWVRVSGEATLYSYIINSRLPGPGFEDDGPYAIAVVELAEGPRMMTNIVGISNTANDLVLDMPLTVTFESRGDRKVPVFTPAEGRAA